MSGFIDGGSLTSHSDKEKKMAMSQQFLIAEESELFRSIPDFNIILLTYKTSRELALIFPKTYSLNSSHSDFFMSQRPRSSPGMTQPSVAMSLGSKISLPYSITNSEL